jgi:glycosyltransferase involved in cell wall biosynthesis
VRVLVVTHPLPTTAHAGTMAPVARQIASLRAIGVHVDVLELDGPGKLKYLRTLPRMHTMLAHADLVHAHFGYVGWLARMQLHRPLVVSFMGDDLLGTPDERGRLLLWSQAVVQLDRLFARMVDAIIVKSAEMARVVAPLRAHVIPNGVDVQTFAPQDRLQARHTLGWDAERRYVLFAGNPREPRKGYALATAAVECAGDARITVVPLVDIPPARVPLLMNAADAMLMTSYIEGSPNVVKEALACNLPVVAVPVGDVPEMLDGVAGCALRPRDPRELGMALRAVLEQGRRSAGREALLRRGLDLESVARRVMCVYDAVLRTRRRNSQP